MLWVAVRVVVAGARLRFAFEVGVRWARMKMP